jgi:hypothetical protein
MTMTTPDDFLSGIDPVSAFSADVEAEVAVEVERRFLGDLSNWKPEGLSGMSSVLGIEPNDD